MAWRQTCIADAVGYNKERVKRQGAGPVETAHYAKLIQTDAGRSADQLAEGIRQMILAGELPPGHRFPNEPQFCALLGVGRSTLREAYRSLEAMGCITRSRRGTEVADAGRIEAALPFPTAVAMADFQDVMEFRLIVETEIAALAAMRATAADLERLRDCLQEMETQVGHPWPFSLADTRFHLEAAAASHNRFLLQLLRSVQDWYNMLILHAVEKEPESAYQAALDAHREVYARILSRDADAARACMHARLLERYRHRMAVEGPQAGER